MGINTRHWILAIGVALLSACQPLQTRIDYELQYPLATTTPPVATVIPARMPQTPFPTRAAVALLDTTAAAPLAAVEAQTIQLFAQTVPAVASIDVEFTHPSVDGSVSERTMLLSQGSGFLYDDQGHIVTNAHVVNDQNDFLVRFGTSRAYTATVIGRDSASDIAVLALTEPVAIAPLTLSQRAPLTGMWVMAIGNPLGLRDSMSIGVVSAVGRTLDNDGAYRIPDIIQVDAAINPGSSGGVLIDSSGAVIGITTAIQSTSGNFEGIGYAIPAHRLQQIVPVLIAQGYYQHPWIGIQMQDNDPRANDGVYVGAVRDGGPAALAGIQVADVIVAIDDMPINAVTDLERLLARISVGNRIAVTVRRQGQPQTLTLEVAARPD